MVDKPVERKETEGKALQRMRLNVFAKLKPGEVVTYSPELGNKDTFYRWRKDAADAGVLTKAGDKYYRPWLVENTIMHHTEIGREKSD